MALRSFSCLVGKASRCKSCLQIPEEILAQQTWKDQKMFYRRWPSSSEHSSFWTQPVTVLRYFDNSKVTLKEDKITCNLYVSDFKAKDITVKTIGSNLIIEAFQEGNSLEAGFPTVTCKTLKKTIALPVFAKANMVKTSLDHTGILSITIPLVSILPINDLESSEKKAKMNNKETPEIVVIPVPTESKQPRA